MVIRKFSTQSFHNFLTLWEAVLEQAKKDLLSGSHNLKEVTRLWFLSGQYTHGSFLWICDVVDEEPEDILKDLFNGKDRAKTKRQRS